MAPKVLLSALLLIAVASQALGAPCGTWDIVAEQSRTGRVVEGQPEYAVDVRNGCACAQSEVKIRCYGMKSYEPVDPRSIKSIDDENCILKNGAALTREAPVRFRYVWKTPQDFPVVSSVVQCGKR
ncbi:hypothetical protein HPP92_021353 [Vanilla planifolia]|uniref:Uncharacterized protein n=1 Tax=Vanilla planifolia TaxID=51239 RepID=A0A835UIG0_VANPL|nr:hypothetical protein HPP92_021691 [Vanilla planifolia]KAG0462877.1 hypothetical protein HPP92_021353 [Vanilla planifolia]